MTRVTELYTWRNLVKGKFLFLFFILNGFEKILEGILIECLIE